MSSGEDNAKEHSMSSALTPPFFIHRNVWMSEVKMDDGNKVDYVMSMKFIISRIERGSQGNQLLLLKSSVIKTIIEFNND